MAVPVIDTHTKPLKSNIATTGEKKGQKNTQTIINNKTKQKSKKATTTTTKQTNNNKTPRQLHRTVALALYTNGYDTEEPL